MYLSLPTTADPVATARRITGRALACWGCPTSQITAAQDAVTHLITHQVDPDPDQGRGRGNGGYVLELARPSAAGAVTLTISAPSGATPHAPAPRTAAWATIPGPIPGPTPALTGAVR